MQYYQHEFASVEDYLHHRAPYLLVDRIVAVRTDGVQTDKVITGEEFFMAGHFPGVAIFPGAMMQEFSTQSAGILIAAKYNPMRKYNTHDPHFNEFALGVLVRVKNAKYKGFARPGDKLVSDVILDDHTANVFDFSTTISIDGKPIMKNSFRLTNVESKRLHGSEFEKNAS